MEPFAADARALRALAHPIRLRLLRLAAEAGEVTSTSASAATGESTANCSFHLRLLARYGFLEAGEGARTRRERPWRLAERHPLADLWRRLEAGGPAFDRGHAELMRRQLRLFDVDSLQRAA